MKYIAIKKIKNRPKLYSWIQSLTVLDCPYNIVKAPALLKFGFNRITLLLDKMECNEGAWIKIDIAKKKIILYL